MFRCKIGYQQVLINDEDAPAFAKIMAGMQTIEESYFNGTEYIIHTNKELSMMRQPPIIKFPDEETFQKFKAARKETANGTQD